MTPKLRQGSSRSDRWPARRRRWTIGLGVGVLALVATAANGGIGAVLAGRAPVERTYQALAALSDLRSQLDDAQRGERGFVLTADEHYLQPYTAAAAEMPQTLAELHRLIGTDTAHQQMINDLQASADATLAVLGQAVTLLRADGFRATRPAVMGTLGTDTLARAEQLLDALRQDQLTVLHDQQRMQLVADQAESAFEMITAAAVTAAVLIGLKAWWTVQSATRPLPRATAAPDHLSAEPGSPADAAAPAPAPEEQQPTWHVPLRVLLAEDNLVNQKIAQFMLGKLGHRVDTVANGLEAVQALRSAEYDVVLMDVQMPVLDGLAATRLIRSEFPADQQPHIIAMTASVLIEDRTACRAAGMNDYLGKPVQMSDLTSALTPLLDAVQDGPVGDGATSDAVSSAPAVTLNSEGLDGYRDAAIRGRLADISDGEPSGPERDLLARLLTSFTAQTPAGIDQLAELVIAGDVTGVRNQAHALKGSAANMGVTRLAELLAEVETNARAGRLPQSPAAMTAIRTEYDMTAPVCERITDELLAGTRR